jgi:outer membrane receptor for ferrienterochelin and colicin
VFNFNYFRKSTTLIGTVLKKTFLAITITALFSNMAQALSSAEVATKSDSLTAMANNAESNTLEKITIFGSKQAVDTAPSPGAYIDKETFHNYAVSDIQRILLSTAGVYFVEQDGHGLRPSGGLFEVYDNPRGKLIGFMTAMDNLHGNCTASQSCSADLIAQQYNAGKADISGIEFIVNHEAKLGNLSIPTRINYTYSNAEFAKSVDTQLDMWGSVESDFEIPYLPEVIWQIETGLRADKWQVLAAIKQADKMRTVAGAGAIRSQDSIKERTMIDLSANYQIDNQQNLYAVVDNLLDKEHTATRQHGGLQVAKPR